MTWLFKIWMSLLLIDRAGIVGADGSTHTGSFDTAYCRCIPNLVMMAPTNASDMFTLLNTAYSYNGPAMVRYPRGNSAKPDNIDTVTTVEIGKALEIRKGQRTALLVFGTLMDIALEMADELNLTIINMRFIKPLDKEMIRQVVESHDYLVTLEDSALPGGAGSAVLEFLNDNQFVIPCLRLGLNDEFPSHGTREQVLEENGLDYESIKSEIIDFSTSLKPVASTS